MAVASSGEGNFSRLGFHSADGRMVVTMNSSNRDKEGRTKDMEATQNVIEIINDLIRINNDRVEGYQKAEHEVKENANTEIKALFFHMIEESRSFAYELSETVLRLGGKPVEDTTTSGKIYRLWMDVRATFTGGSMKAVLESCEFGEDAAIKTYKEAMEEENVVWPEDVFQMISRQRQSIQASHNKIKQVRDYFKTADVR